MDKNLTNIALFDITAPLVTPALVTHDSANQPETTAAVLWLHGLGADGHDFEAVVHALNLPHIRFLLPHAPYLAISMNNGYRMRAWYDLFGLRQDSKDDLAGLEAMHQLICKRIAEIQQSGIPAARIALAGFSQGGAMALYSALRCPVSLAGVLGLSTYLPVGARLAQEGHSANHKTPIWLAHGALDDVIPLAVGRNAKQVLEALQYMVEWHEYSMAHALSLDELSDIRQFLLHTLPP